MGTTDDLHVALRDCLIGAAESPPEQRAKWVEPVATHGDAGIEAVLEWVHDSDLAPFAFQVIVRAAALGIRQTGTCDLQDIERRQLDPTRFAALIRATDTIAALPPSEPHITGAFSVTAIDQPIRPLPLRRLVSGEVYRRRDELHPSGLGADIFKGISYRTHGNHVLLFTGGHGAHEFGYRDGWHGDEFHYFGERRGDGDMQLTAGNNAIVERSPQIYLFSSVAKARYRFEGRFAVAGKQREPVNRDGGMRQAIVFRLRKVADVVDLPQPTGYLVSDRQS